MARRTVAVLVGVAVLLAGCGGDEDPADGAGSSPATTSGPTDTDDGDPDDADPNDAEPNDGDPRAGDPEDEASDSVADESPDTDTSPEAVEVGPPQQVLGPAEGRSFLNPGAVVRDADGRLHAFRNSFDGFPGPTETDRLVSDDDGVTWTPAGPVLTTDDVPFATRTVFVMTGVVADDGTWVVYFQTYEGVSGPGHIGRASAPAPEGPWTVDPEPVLTSGPEGAWDARRLAEPQVVVEPDGTWRMWFVGFDERLVGAIGTATSPDGITWTKAPEPVFAGAQEWDTGSVGAARVVRRDDGWVMLYDIARRATNRLGLAVSDDGLTWTPLAANPVLEAPDFDGATIWQSAMVGSGDDLLVFQEVGDGARQGTTDVRRVVLSLTPP